MRWTHPDYVHRGVPMRSLGEVVWARWFDDHDLAWEYEPVKFRKHYTPDFGLHDRALFVEVKSKPFASLNKFHLCDKPLLVVLGRPEHADVLYRQPPHGLVLTDWAAARELLIGK